MHHARPIFQSGLCIRYVEANSADLWDNFIRENSGTYCHLYGWKRVFEDAYGLRGHYLGAYQNEALCAVLPIAEMPHLPWGERRAVSLPYCNYGGLVAIQGMGQEQMLTAMLEYLNKQGISCLELRDLAPNHEQTEEVSMLVALPSSEEELWKRVGDKVRNQVRKGKKAGLELRWGHDQGQDLYSIYAKNMGRLGSPVHSRLFVLGILEALHGQSDVLTVRLDGRSIGAMLVLRHQNIWVDPVASCLAEFNFLNPSMLMYWEALRQACAMRATIFDLGRSQKGSGTYHFKRQWGAQEMPLYYHSFVKGKPVDTAATAFYRSNGASKLAKLWSHLPALLQNNLGPVIRRWMP